MKETFYNTIIGPQKQEMLIYLKSLRPYFILTCIVFLLGIIAGYLFAIYQFDIVNELINEFQKKIDIVSGASHFEIMLFIFSNNAMVNFVLIISGIFFSIPSILIVLTNGILIGIVFFQFASQYGFLLVFITLIPHGIIEIPITFTSASIGMKLGVRIFQKIFQIKQVDLKYEFLNAIRIYLIVIIPLIFIAAIIETYFTTMVLDFLLSIN
ncbi:MAG: stage II sporulation protein M [Methanosarcinales archaeon]|nr:stage II sporulation protein M [Methanosarcinales archaeon]